jgi:hypothetical protein
VTDTPFRQAVLEALRAELVQHEHSQYSLPSTAEFYRGHPFFKGDLEKDVVLWLQSHALPRLKGAKGVSKVLTTLHRLNDNVCADFAHDAARAAQLLLRDGGLTPGVDLVLDDIFRRCALYAWEMGHQHLAPDVAVCAYALAARSRETVHIVRYTQKALTALASAMTPGPRGDRERGRAMKGALGRLVGWGYYAKETSLAEEALKAEDKEAIRDHIEKQFRRIADLDAGKALAEADNVEPAGLDDADAFMLEPALQRPVTPTGPSLIVVRDLSHLPEGKYDRGAPRAEFSPIEGVPLPLAPVPDLAEASTVLRGEFPWLAEPIDRLLGSLAGRDCVRMMPPSLFLGRSGCGKTHLARRVAEVLQLQHILYPAGGSQDSAVAGTNRQWSSSRAALPTQLILRTRSASPCLIVDEIDKAGTSRKNGQLHDALLSMLGEGREAFLDPFLEAPVDLSGVVWLFTANERQPLRGPLLDRLVVLDCPDPGPGDMDAIVQGLLAQARKESGIDARFTPDLDSTEYAVLRRGWRGGSIRPLKRAFDRLLALRSAPGLAH